nr:type I restriction-modification system subunit M N-terminal domain-containing protein [Escherichia coli]
MSSTNFSQIAAFLWSVADLLRGDFKQSQYGRIILPFTLLRRLECVLETTKDAVIAEAQKVKAMKLPEEAQEKMILRATNGLTFFNASAMDLSKMGQNGAKWHTGQPGKLHPVVLFGCPRNFRTLQVQRVCRTAGGCELTVQSGANIR